MKKIILFASVLTMLFSCGNSKKGNMIVKGKISGLEKGTLYLQKMIDTSIVSVDSLQFFGEKDFELSDNVDSPEMYYLTYSGAIKDKKLMFFGEPGEIFISDNIEEFGFKPKISGSENQKAMDDFKEVNQKFKMQRLDFIKRDYEARATGNEFIVDSLEKAYNRFVRKRFLFTTNFAIANKDKEVAPYIALSELFDANLYLLDTINVSLTDDVKKSRYGKQLQRFIDDVKSKEK